ncbi:hypothetical protein ACFL0X_02285 [Nanoarchaeota archaeon]
MAETISHRLTNLIEEGIHILCLKGNLHESSESTAGNLPWDYYAPTRELKQFLGDFSDRGGEYIVGQQDIDVTELGSEFHRTHPFTQTAIAYAKREGFVENGVERFKMEVHAIEDPKLDKTYFFGMPHRDYIKE